MFNIRKIQEQAIYKAVKDESDDKTADEIVYGKPKTIVENDSA